MAKIKLIGEQFIKDYSPVMQNVSTQFLSMHILESQDIELRYVIGDNLLAEIISGYTGYAENPGGDIDDYVVEKNQILRDNYIKYILLYYTLYRSAPDFDSKITNKGIEQQHSDYSVNKISYENRRKGYKNDAESYVARMLDYLETNIATYPLYATFIGCNGEKSFDNGWYLGSDL